MTFRTSTLVRTRLAPSGPSGRLLDDVSVADRVVCEPEPEERLEAGHGGAAAVVAEDELVEVDGQVLG